MLRLYVHRRIHDRTVHRGQYLKVNLNSNHEQTIKLLGTNGCDMNRQRQIMMNARLRPVGGTLRVAVTRGLINQRKLL